jgi:thioredoxin reductase (NADPH)
MIETDLIIIGAGPVGLFTVFEAGLLKLKCHLIDALPMPGGQCAEIYPKKPIYDIPAYPEILAGDLVTNLMKQIEPFNPGFTLGEAVVDLKKTDDGQFIVTTKQGTQHKAPAVAIAGGLGVFVPRRPLIENLRDFEDKGIAYFIKTPEVYNGKKVIISGGGDSALDWAIYLAEEGRASDVTLIHRTQNFRAHPDSVQKAMDMAAAGKIKMMMDSEVVGVGGDGSLNQITVKTKEGEQTMDTEYWLPLFGLTPKLGPIANWGLEIEKNAIVVNNAVDYATNIDGVYAIGDVNSYPGKLKLILCGFHEATIMVQSVFKRIYPDKKNVLKYTTVNGVNGF